MCWTAELNIMRNDRCRQDHRGSRLHDPRYKAHTWRVHTADATNDTAGCTACCLTLPRRRNRGTGLAVTVLQCPDGISSTRRAWEAQTTGPRLVLPIQQFIGEFDTEV